MRTHRIAAQSAGCVTVSSLWLLFATTACAERQPRAEPSPGRRHETLQISASHVLPINARDPNIVVTYFRLN